MRQRSWKDQRRARLGALAGRRGAVASCGRGEQESRDVPVRTMTRSWWRGACSFCEARFLWEEGRGEGAPLSGR